MNAFVDYLKFELKVRQKTYSTLAKELGVSHATVRRWLEGEDKPEIKSALKLSKYFNIEVANLIDLSYGAE